MKFEEIKGLAYVKRAMEVAIAGSHSIAFIGSIGTGKTTLAGIVKRINPKCKTYESRQCYCGNYGSRKRACGCSASKLTRFWLKKDKIELKMKSDIVVEVQELLENETSYGENEDIIIHRINSCGNEKNLSLSQEAEGLWKSAIRHLSLSTEQQFKLINVAKTIANLEQAKEISASHVAEASQYRFTQ